MGAGVARVRARRSERGRDGRVGMGRSGPVGAEGGVAAVAVALGQQPSQGYSHSMVPGGLLVTSSTTRFTSATSFVIRVEIRSSTS
ncbi:hypothetical protein LV75_004975 [Actinokineospora diospyrosa]|uniref:Uncharacterized protein n=1 Tax=Actinokineospora diospyrosa TaxID=103728 RepID=A0ABT1IIS4_9PSEU|nr:hypothetical protein [Actinokineospora diospyrosa]